MIDKSITIREYVLFKARFDLHIDELKHLLYNFLLQIKIIPCVVQAALHFPNPGRLLP